MSDDPYIDDLVCPDGDKHNPKYEWDTRYQQEVLSMLLNDRVFLTQSLELVRPTYFTDLVHETICASVIEYFVEYKQTPAKFVLLELVKQRLKDPKKLAKVYGEVELILGMWVPGMESRDHCLQKITEFAKEQALRSAVLATTDLLKRRAPDRWQRIEHIFRQAILVDRNFDLGLDYFNTLDDRYERMRLDRENNEVFVTGFRGIDERLANGGLRRGEIGAFMGLPGTGKSVMLIHCAVQNICRGKKVLYVTLEMSQDGIAKRFDSQLTRTKIGELAGNEEKVKSLVSEWVSSEEDKRRLYIKQFAAGTADVNTVRAFLSQASLQGFKPDLIIVDYVGEMKDFEGIKTYESRQRLVRDLRALAVEEQLCVLTAMQPNRRGREQQQEGVIDDDSLGDSFGQARPLDALWSINMNQNEKTACTGRLFIVKHRDGMSRHTVFIKADDDALDFREIQEGEYRQIMSRTQESTSDDQEAKMKKIFSKKKQEERLSDD